MGAGSIGRGHGRGRALDMLRRCPHAASCSRVTRVSDARPQARTSDTGAAAGSVDSWKLARAPVREAGDRDALRSQRAA